MNELDDAYLGNNEVPSRKHLTFDPGRRAMTVILGGAATVMGSFAIWYATYQEAGTIISFDPTVEVEKNVDGVFKAASLNTHREIEEMIPEIREKDEELDLDIFAFQEAKLGDIKVLHEAFPEKYINGVIADSKTGLFAGTANVIMSDQELTDIERTVLKGSALGSEAIRTYRGVGQGSSKEVIDATQEYRAILSGKIQVATPEGLKPVTVTNLHLPGDPLFHDEHFAQALDHIEGQKQDGTISVVLGDFNDNYNDVSQALTTLGFMVPKTDPTTKDAVPKVVDYYAQEASPESYLFVPTAKVIPTEGSDHEMLYIVSHAK